MITVGVHETFCIVEDGAIFTETSAIHCNFQVRPRDGLYLVDIQVIGGSGAVNNTYIDGTQRTILNAALDAITPTGSNARLKILNTVEQAVKTYLESLTYNASTTFTIT